MELNDKIEKIKKAVLEVFNISESEMKSCSRDEKLAQARMIYAFQAAKSGCSVMRIAENLDRGRGTILHYLNQYNDEFSGNYEFKIYTNKVNEKLL